MEPMETRETRETVAPPTARDREHDRERGVPGYLTIAQAAALLGITRGAVYQRIRKLGLPVLRAGRTLLLDGDAMMQLFAKVKSYHRS